MEDLALEVELDEGYEDIIVDVTVGNHLDDISKVSITSTPAPSGPKPPQPAPSGSMPECLVEEPDWADSKQPAGQQHCGSVAEPPGLQQAAGAVGVQSPGKANHRKV
ncbi:hypothetical protein DPEC_G00208910 [Dallia pectoralis]|uniref:Uncharacterized protein n=1 Tax=Dallia pectoralis TaxID=75939 RepID=A0ACC2G597_DALPE|nr:hypothetical protein DPEC_G00208910 [Dallia pectoralis]